MEIIFKDKYVNYNQISDIPLLQINNILIKNDIFLELGDDFTNDWAGYSYYYCKISNNLDEQTISSFVYIITYFMTGNALNINPHFECDKYYKNDAILTECLDIYNNLFNKYSDEVQLCKNLFIQIYEFYVNNCGKYVKRSERMNCLLSYKDMRLFDKIQGESRSDKLKYLLDYYYNR